MIFFVQGCSKRCARSMLFNVVQMVQGVQIVQGVQMVQGFRSSIVLEFVSLFIPSFRRQHGVSTSVFSLFLFFLFPSL
jgi:hypothetical protein